MRTGPMSRWWLPSVMTLALMSAWGCDSPPLSEPVTGEDAARIKAELEGRSFRQFEPSWDGDPRKGAILDFFGPIAIWAQYAEGEWAVNEWEIFADDYRVEGYADGSEVTIYLEQPRSQQTIPTECDDCIPTDNVSLSVRNVFDSESISFKLNDSDGSLPLPFPVFHSWTTFSEDEYFE